MRSDKRLAACLFVCVFSVASLVGAADQASQTDWTDQLKQPFSLFKWGADLRLRHEHMWNQYTLSNDQPDNEWGYERYRPRVWGTVTPAAGVELNGRLTWEGRHFWLPDTKNEWFWGDLIADALNVKLTKPGDLPITVVAGRQDIMLGGGWLIADGTPLDGSKTWYFDAVNLTVDVAAIKTSVQLIYIDQQANPMLRWDVSSDKEAAVSEQDERGAIVWITNKSIEKTEAGAFFIWKKTTPELVNGDSGERYTAGLHVDTRLTDHIRLTGQGGFQWGSRNGADVTAGGFLGRAYYMFNDALKNELRLTYEFLSGDDPDTADNEQFDPLWGRWPQWSELLIYTYVIETRLEEITNLHRVTASWVVEPAARLKFTTEYSLLFAAQNNKIGNPIFADSGKFRGQLLRAFLEYTFNKHMSGHIWGEMFLPGNYFADDRDDAAFFLRLQLILTL